MKGDHLKTLENFRKNENVSKNAKGGHLGFLNMHSVAKCQKIKGDLLETLKFFRKKSHNAEKIERGGGSLVSFVIVCYAKKEQLL